MAVPTITNNFERYFLSANAAYSDIDGTSTFVEQYRIKKRIQGAPSPSIAQGDIVLYNDSDYQLMVDELVIPANGDDRTTWSGANTCAFPQITMRLRSTEFASNQDGSVTVTLTWTTMYGLKPSTVNTATPYWAMPVSVEWAGGTRTMTAWRRNWTINPPSTLDSTGADIGGGAYRGKLQGVEIQVPQIRVRLKFTLDATVTSMMDQYNAVSAYIGKKNNDIFLNFPVETLICESITMGKIQHEYYELIFEFLWDGYAHHDQVAATQPDGEVELDINGLPKTVYWERVARTSAPFNNIWNGDPDLQGLAERGYWL